MSGAQTEFGLFEADQEDANVQRFVAFLKAVGGWRKSREIYEVFGMTNSEPSRRMLRAWAEASDGEIVSGQKGYCYLRFATPDEIRQASESLISQGKKLIRRGIKTRRLAHAVLG